MAVRDYTARILDKRAKQTSFDSLDYTPIAIPAGAVLPETTQQTMARMMLSSGMISLDDYHKMIGVVYDGDFAAEQETFGDDEEFGSFRERLKQSSFAEYEDDSHDDGQGLRLAPTTGDSGAVSNSSSAAVGADSSDIGETRQVGSQNQSTSGAQANVSSQQSAESEGSN